MQPKLKWTYSLWNNAIQNGCMDMDNQNTKIIRINFCRNQLTVCIYFSCWFGDLFARIDKDCCNVDAVDDIGIYNSSITICFLAIILLLVLPLVNTEN